jgi:flagellar basal-body rod protein FlgB
MDKLDAEFKFGQEALNLRDYRQQILSSNIANADTPNYKARDLDFASTLSGVMARAGMPTGVPGNTLQMTPPSEGTAATAGGGVTLSTDAQGQIGSASAGSSEYYGPLLYRNPDQPSADNNTVDLDTERIAFADNSLHYESTLTEINGQIKAMTEALSTGT